MHKFTRKQRRLLIPLLSTSLILLGTYLAIQFAKGYRPSRDGLRGTGLLAANSFPPGAEVYINGKLTTATDDTLNLPPGDYTIDINKDGYTPWTKAVTIQAELVTQTNATLFRSVLSLTPLTLSGALNINPSPNGQRIAYAVASASASAKNGLYVLELSSTPLSLQNSPRQIARNLPNLDFSQADILWSPNSSQIIAHFKTGPEESSNYLLTADSFNDLSNLTDTTARLPIILSEWEEDIVLRESKQFALLPEEFKKIATTSATNLYFSPNEERLLYTTTEYVSLPPNLISPPPSTNTQPEERDLQSGGIYIYDLTEDKNFRIGGIDISGEKPTKRFLLTKDYQQLTDTANNLDILEVNPSISQYEELQDPTDLSRTFANFRLHYSSIYTLPYQWYPDSSHILILNQGKTEIIEYDSTNRVTIYAGPNSGDFVYPWPDGSKLIVPTNLNPNSNAPVNLYAVDIR